MSLARATAFGCLFIAAYVHCTLPACRSDDVVRAASPAFQAAFEKVLTDGFKSRTSLTEIESNVTRARTLEPKDPAIDYAYGLILMKRLKHDQAVDAFLAAAKVDPTYLPARQALFRLRLTRKETQQLMVEMVDFAGVIADPNAPWPDDKHRSDAAEYLGRLGEFLSTSSKLVEAEARQKAANTITERLGLKYVDSYSKGAAELVRDQKALLEKIEDQKAEQAERTQKQAAEKMSKLDDRREKTNKKAETARQAKEKTNATLGEQLKTIDGKLEEAKKEYDAANQSVQRFERLLEESNVELARLQTFINFIGTNKLSLDEQMQMQTKIQTLQRDQAEFQRGLSDAQSKSQQITDSANQLLEERNATADDHQKSKGELQKDSKAVERWNAALSKAAEKSKKNAAAAKNAATAKKVVRKEDLNRPATFFPLEYDDEAARLMQEHGIELKAARVPAKPDAQ